MTVIEFPPVDYADENGLLAVGGDLEVDSLLLAYRSGVFPWPINERQLTWFAPPERTLLFLDEFHPSRSLRKELKRKDYELVINRNFEAVIRACAESNNRSGQRGTWITNQIIDGFVNFHRAGFAHSIECYKSGELAGGLYGVAIGHYFGGESMFYHSENGSKLALCYLVDYLRSRSVEWIDCQVSNPFLESIGARSIPRVEFMKMLPQALAVNGSLF